MANLERARALNQASQLARIALNMAQKEEQQELNELAVAMAAESHPGLIVGSIVRQKKVYGYWTPTETECAQTWRVMEITGRWFGSTIETRLLIRFVKKNGEEGIGTRSSNLKDIELVTS